MKKAHTTVDLGRATTLTKGNAGVGIDLKNAQQELGLVKD